MSRRIREGLEEQLRVLNADWNLSVVFVEREPTLDELRDRPELRRMAAWVNPSQPNQINLHPQFLQNAAPIILKANHPDDYEFDGEGGLPAGRYKLYSSQMDSHEAIIVHEYAHVLTNNLTDSKRESLRKKFEEPDTLMSRVFFISDYASQSADEGIAEAFLLFHKDGDNKWTQAVMTVFD